MSIETLNEKLKAKFNITLVDNDELRALNSYKFHNLNTNNVLVEMECKHQKLVKISTLYNSKKVVCIICKNMDKYNYNSETMERTCGECNHIHQNVPNSNHSMWKCCFCKEKIKKEVDLMKFLIEKGYEISKNYRYIENKGSLTGDLYFKIEDKTYVIEVDESSHLSMKRKLVHLKKDDIILNGTNIVLLRVHKDDINAFANKFEELVELLNEKKIIVFRNTEKSVEFYNKIYKMDTDIVFV